jgi:hypothetical protein
MKGWGMCFWCDCVFGCVCLGKGLERASDVVERVVTCKFGEGACWWIVVGGMRVLAISSDSRPW